MDILITRHLTLRPLLEVDADDIRELITIEPALASKLPRAMIKLIGSDDQSKAAFEPSSQTLVVIREKLIGWVSLDAADATAFAAGGENLRNEALAAALHFFARYEIAGAASSSQQQAAQFAT